MFSEGLPGFAVSEVKKRQRRAAAARGECTSEVSPSVRVHHPPCARCRKGGGGSAEGRGRALFYRFRRLAITMAVAERRDVAPPLARECRQRCRERHPYGRHPYVLSCRLAMLLLLNDIIPTTSATNGTARNETLSRDATPDASRRVVSRRSIRERFLLGEDAR